MVSDYPDYLCNSHMFLPSLVAYFSSFCWANYTILDAILNAPINLSFLQKCYCSYSYNIFMWCALLSHSFCHQNPVPNTWSLRVILNPPSPCMHTCTWGGSCVILKHEKCLPCLWLSTAGLFLVLHSYYELLVVAPHRLPVSSTARTIFDLVWCEAYSVPAVLPRAATALGRNRITDFSGLCHWSARGVR